jgi:hypothetical protein
MARGWESKSVETQIDMAERRPTHRVPHLQAPETLERLRQNEALQSTRTRILHDLDSAQNLRYRELLTKTLAELDSRIAQA